MRIIVNALRRGRSGANRVLNVSVLVGSAVCLFPRDAFAYLDPGTGSMVVQSVIAAVAAAAYGVRLYWGRIRGVFGRRPSAAGDRVQDATRTTE
jgi:hypothetical protein